MMTKKMVYQNSMTPWVGVVKLCIILMMCINIQHIYCYCIKGLKLSFFLQTRSQFTVSNTQLTAKTGGLLVQSS